MRPRTNRQASGHKSPNPQWHKFHRSQIEKKKSSCTLWKTRLDPSISRRNHIELGLLLGQLRVTFDPFDIWGVSGEIRSTAFHSPYIMSG